MFVMIVVSIYAMLWGYQMQIKMKKKVWKMKGTEENTFDWNIQAKTDQSALVEAENFALLLVNK